MTGKSDEALHDLVCAIEKIRVHDHLCLIYETREEQFSAVIPFMKIGLERGEKCLYVVDDTTAAMVIDAMQDAGIDVKSSLKSGKLAIVSKQDSYLKQGYFDPDWMIGFLRRATDEAKAAGFSALRVTGEMTWVLGGDPGTEHLMAYEAKLNYFFPSHDALAICQYNRSRFSPSVIKDVIATHPTVICGGMVCSNFYYVPPDEFLGDGRPAREVGRLLANIVARRQTEEKLRRYQERLEELVEERTVELKRVNDRFSMAATAAGLGVWDWDIGNNTLVWDDTMYALYGIKKDDFAGAYEAWLQGIHPDDRASCDEASRRARSGEQDYDTEFRVVWPDGSLHYLKAYGQVVRAEDGRPLRMTGVNFDITERKQAEQAEQAVFEAQQAFRALIENSPDIIARYDRDCRRTYVNPTYLRVAGISPQEWLATTPVQHSPLPEGSAVVLQNLLRRVLDTGVAEAVDVIWPKSDNIDYWYNVYAFPECDREGRIVSVMAVSRDITDRKSAEQALNRINEELEQRVSERTRELERRNHELEEMNKAFVGRELKMVELKERIRALEEQKSGGKQ